MLARSLDDAVRIQVLKVRFCLRRTGELSTWTESIRRIYKVEGLRAFWRGYVLNQIGIIPYAGLDLACYEVKHRRLADSSLESTCLATLLESQTVLHQEASEL